jgi:hypothetical protein
MQGVAEQASTGNWGASPYQEKGRKMIGNRALTVLIAAVVIALTATSGHSYVGNYAVAPGGTPNLGNLWKVAAEQGAAGISGMWQGMSQAYCGAGTPASRCNAVQKITLDLRQTNGKVTGSYTCAYGNMVCRNLNTTGKVVSGEHRSGNATIRVLMPDGSTCRFGGRFTGQTGIGNYVCYSGGRQIERGTFRLSRAM